MEKNGSCFGKCYLFMFDCWIFLEIYVGVESKDKGKVWLMVEKKNWIYDFVYVIGVLGLRVMMV